MSRGVLDGILEPKKDSGGGSQGNLDEEWTSVNGNVSVSVHPLDTRVIQCERLVIGKLRVGGYMATPCAIFTSFL